MNQRTYHTHHKKLVDFSQRTQRTKPPWLRNPFQLDPSKVKQFEKHLAQICGCSAVRRPGTPGTPTTGATWSIISGMKPPKLEIKRQKRDDFVVGELVGGSKMLKHGMMIYIRKHPQTFVVFTGAETIDQTTISHVVTEKSASPPDIEVHVGPKKVGPRTSWKPVDLLEGFASPKLKQTLPWVGGWKMRYGPFPMARREWTLNQLAPLASGKDREDEVPLNICYFSGSNSKKSPGHFGTLMGKWLNQN